MRGVKGRMRISIHRLNKIRKVNKTHSQFLRILTHREKKSPLLFITKPAKVPLLNYKLIFTYHIHVNQKMNFIQ